MSMHICMYKPNMYYEGFRENNSLVSPKISTQIFDWVLNISQDTVGVHLCIFPKVIINNNLLIAKLNTSGFNHESLT